jgi:hypothetical protein
MTYTLLLAALAVTATAAPSTQQPTGGQAPQPSTAPRANQQITVSGCVAAGPNNTFTLTAAPTETQSEAPTGTTATTPAGTKVAKTITYTLAGGNPSELQSHVGHTVQVTGVEAAPQVSTAVKESRQGQAAPQGTSGTSGATAAGSPKVETTSQAQIVVRQLTVSSVKMVSQQCDLVK